MMRGTTIVFGLLLIGSSTSALLADPNAERALQTANGLLERGLPAEAEPEYRAALEGLERDDALNEARYGLALSLFRTRDFAGSLGALSEITEGSGFAFAADAALLGGHALHRTGRHHDAAETLTRFTREHPEHGGWNGAAALAVECAHRGGDHRQAVRLARRFAERLGTSAEGRRAAFFAAVSHAERGRDADAIAAFEQIARGEVGDPLTDQAMLRLARSLEQVGRREEAIGSYEAAAEATDLRVRHDAVIGLAALLRETGKPDRARRMLESLRRDAPRHRPERVMLELGLSELALDRPGAAAALFERIERDRPLLDDAAYWHARAESAAGEHRRAAQRLTRSIEAYPESPLRPRMLYDLGVTLDLAGMDEPAHDAFVAFREAYPEHRLIPDALHAEAALLLDAGDLDGAVDRASRMLASHGDHDRAAETAFVLGEAEYRRGHSSRAVDVFAALLERAEEAADRDPDLVTRARYRLGMSLHAEGRADEALLYLLEVTDGERTEARFAPALRALGDTAFDARAWDDAVAYLGDYLLFGDENPNRRDDAMMRLGLSLARLSRHQDALGVFNGLASGNGPHAAHALFESGQSLATLGREDDAAGRFEQLLSTHPASRFEGHALRYLGSIAMRRGDTPTAESYLSRAGEQLDDDTSLDIERVRALLELDRAPEALGILGDRERGEPAERSAWRIVTLARADRPRDAVRALEVLDTGAVEGSLLATAEFEVSRCLRELGRVDDAEELLRRLAESGTPVTFHSAIELASILNERDEFAEARRVLAGPLDASDLPATLCPSAVYQSAWASHRLGDHEAVVALLAPESRRCDLGGATPAAELLYAEALLETGHPRRAAAHFSILIERFADSGEAETARLRLGDSHAAAQLWDESRRAYTAYLREHPDSPLWFRARFGLGWATENAGDPHTAIEHYRLVTDAHRGSTAARAQFQIGECLFAMRQHEEAVRELLRVDILHNQPEWSAAALFEAGRCFEAMEKVGEARAQYRDVVARFGESDWAQAASERLAALQTGRVPGRGGDE